MPTSDPLAFSETNGAATPALSEKSHIVDPSFDEVSASLPSGDAPKEVKTASRAGHQAHGAAFASGPISSVQQLIARKSLVKGSMGSFGSLEEYREHIDTLTLGELHAHAVDSMETPIYETQVLKTRLERKWTEVSARSTPGRGAGGIKHNVGYTPEQNAKAQELLKKMQRR